MALRALLVGAGGMGKAWGRNLVNNKDVQLSGWVDIRKEAAAAAVEQMKLDDVFVDDDLSRALSEVKPDFLVDVTIPESHHSVTLTALKAGVPVIGEKPMAHSMDAARAMVAAADKAGKLYMVSQSRRYDSRITAYRKLVKEVAGTPEILNSDFYIGAHFGGFRDEMAHVLLLDMAIHTFDAARLISGQDPVSVYCEEFNPSWSWYKGASSAVAMFELTQRVRYTYRGSWSAEGANTSWEAEWRATGPHGTAMWDGNDAIWADKVVETGGFHSKSERVEAVVEPEPGGIEGSLRDFINAVSSGQTPMGECHDNIKSLAMVFAAIESAETGQRVKIQI